MAKSQQNRVPETFKFLYLPILNLKRFLQKEITLSKTEIVYGFVMLHFATFVIRYFVLKGGNDGKQHLKFRKTIEDIFHKDQLLVYPEHISEIARMVDKFGKELNTNYQPQIFVALYLGHLDSEIYRHFHSELGIFEYTDIRATKPSASSILKAHFEAALDYLTPAQLELI